MPSARLFPLPALAVAVHSLVGCAGAERRLYTPEELRSEFETRVSTQMRDEIVIPFEIDEEIRQLARDVTRGASRDDEKVRAIVHSIIDLEGFSISYDWLSNKTAKEVFRQGKGNCLAYSNLFVGMARAVGLDATFASVSFTERITREAEIIVNSAHITAAVKPATGRAVLIDFTRTPERQYVGFELIDDLEAIASFYNNQGFLYGYFTETEDVDFDPLERELEMYRLALEILPSFSRARNNLGVALRRSGRVDEAIEQYKLAWAGLEPLGHDRGSDRPIASHQHDENDAAFDPSARTLPVWGLRPRRCSYGFRDVPLAPIRQFSPRWMGPSAGLGHLRVQISGRVVQPAGRGLSGASSEHRTAATGAVEIRVESGSFCRIGARARPGRSAPRPLRSPRAGCS